MKLRYLMSLTSALVLAGCASNGSGDSAGSSLHTDSADNAGVIAATISPQGSMPYQSSSSSGISGDDLLLQISGSPATTVLVDATYRFKPTVAHASSADLRFTFLHCPSWAVCSDHTGEIVGHPTAADVGTFPQIVVSVTAGDTSESLSPFSVTVNESASGSAELSWVAPVDNMDGSPIADLAGYRIYYGQDPRSLENVFDVTGASRDSVVLGNLEKGPWYFSVKAYTKSKFESNASEIGRKVIL